MFVLSLLVGSAHSQVFNNFTYIGCFNDGAGGRTLGAKATVSQTLTVQTCTAFCSGYALAGLEYGVECYCDNYLRNNQTIASSQLDCNMPCSGNSSQTCGAGNRLSMWSLNGAEVKQAVPPSIQTTNLPTGWSYKGCLMDGAPRSLQGAVYMGNDVQPSTCIAYCVSRGFKLAGLEYSNECYCSNSITAGYALALESDCSMTCAGNETYFCGNGNRLTYYEYANLPATLTLSTTSISGSSMTTLQNTASVQSTATSTLSLIPTVTPSNTINGFISVGCYTDGVAGRALAGKAITNTAMTVEICTAFCSGYQLAGVEYGVECYCDNAIKNSNGIASIQADCNMACPGNSLEKCGAGNRLNVWSVNGTTPVIQLPPTVQQDNLPIGWTYQGCLNDGPVKALQANTKVMSDAQASTCIAFCASKGQTLAGIEYGNECYCDSAIRNSYTFKPESECNMACAGNSTRICGSGYRLSLYGYDPNALGNNNATTKISGLPTGWVYSDCYTSYPSTEVLTETLSLSAHLTVTDCIQQCAATGYSLAGLERGNQCLCDYTIKNQHVPSTGCNSPCVGNSSEVCGGFSRVSLYNNTLVIPPTPVVPPPPSIRNSSLPIGWVYLGCYIDSIDKRALPLAPAMATQSLTITSCLTHCNTTGYITAGVEYGAECFCDNSIRNNAPLTLNDECNMVCAGNSSEFCGAANRINIYNNTIGVPSVPVGGGGVPVVPGGNEPASAVPKTVISSNKNYTFAGCYTEGVFPYGRALGSAATASTSGTVESCVAFCISSGNYTIAGVEFGTECYCGDVIRNGAHSTAMTTACAMPCGGNNTETCGGAGLLTVYTLDGALPTVLPPPVPRTTNLPAGWTYQGCYQDAKFGPNKAVPYQRYFANNMTIDNCINHCGLHRYPVAAAQYGSECWCGDFIHQDAGLADDPIQCSTACTGNPLETCGAGFISNIYVHSDPLYMYNYPTVTGYYEQYMGGVDVPLLAGVVPFNGKVVFLSRLAGGSPNTTHAYEYDWKDRDYRTAFREMHILTDIFCAAGIILPDNLGRFLAVAGWAFEALQGVRIYKPSGSYNVNGTTDWEENPPNMHLLVPRWYPTTVTLSNGTILVIGGSREANTPNEPTIEILPNPLGITPKQLPLLVETDGHNLYSGAFVMPTGLVYIFAGDRAQLFDPADFSVVKEMPKAPNSVFGTGYRSYPYTGTPVMLPLKAPNYEVEILVCGGGRGGGMRAIDSCIRQKPESNDPSWIVERLPFPSVMPNMVTLPDGTFLYVNGGREGVAGFGLAKQPVLTALLYDPEKPTHNRISILGNTTVPRMYHSQATLLADGHVLITGSDAADTDFPPEFRIERYVPPYIASGIPRPTFNITKTNPRQWEYGEVISIKADLPSNNQFRVSFMRDGVNTHSTHFDQRFIWLEVKRSLGGGEYEIIAPPNANVAPPGWYQIWVLDGKIPSKENVWIRIGHDPSNLYQWPNVPGYNLTGLGTTIQW
ncbi:hypothetical protein HK098_004156 [Nowakowskiella sp. JEL0407]|nr:hypothetical protein HK098_004156 [Nowakowskiella sp. JEL0407]